MPYLEGVDTTTTSSLVAAAAKGWRLSKSTYHALSNRMDISDESKAKVQRILEEQGFREGRHFQWRNPRWP